MSFEQRSVFKWLANGDNKLPHKGEQFPTNECEYKSAEKISGRKLFAPTEIINRKKATYYGIGLGLTKIIKAILNDENEILTVSTYLDGQYNHDGIFIGVPAIINHQGVQEILELNLDKEEQGKLDNSCNVLNDMLKEIESEI